MTIIEKTWTQFPGEPIAQAEIAELLPRWLSGQKLKVAEQIFRRSAVQERHMVLHPSDLVAEGRTFAVKNAVYVEAIRREIGALCGAIRAEVEEEALGSIDLLVTASCTGFQIPAMDALVIHELGLPVSLRRVNLTQHGCAAGAASIGLAHEWLSARPHKRALVVCSELCSLTFQPEDTSGENIVSAAIFGDGSAAALLAGPEAPRQDAREGRLRVRCAHREFFPETEHFMGFDVNDAGLKIKLSRDVVPFAQERLPALFESVCEAWGVPSAAAFETGAVHPGGRRILEVLEDDVGLATSVTRTSWECLLRYGNLSSVSVLAALDRLIHHHPPARPGALGLISAFGPGFCAELGLVEAIPAAA
jgi:predicted naringenin-chalcone synthase